MQILETANGIAQLALTVTLLVGAVVAAVQGTRWGRSRALRTLAEVNALVQEVARAAVLATEQSWRKAPLPVTPDGQADREAVRELKLSEAARRARELLPADVEVSDETLETAIEAAVGRMNAAR